MLVLLVQAQSFFLFQTVVKCLVGAIYSIAFDHAYVNSPRTFPDLLSFLTITTAVKGSIGALIVDVLVQNF